VRAAAALGVPAVGVTRPPPIHHYGPDGIHPGAEGVSWLAERVARHLAAQISRVAGRQATRRGTGVMNATTRSSSDDRGGTGPPARGREVTR
jgi:hypothetical protein